MGLKTGRTGLKSTIDTVCIELSVELDPLEESEEEDEDELASLVSPSDTPLTVFSFLTILYLLGLGGYLAYY